MNEDEYSVVNSNIQKKIIKKGIRGKRPHLDWTCDVTLSYENQDTAENFQIKIGGACNPRDRLIEQCLQTMYLEEESSFVIKLDKRDTYLKVNIKLNSFISKGYIFEWSPNEKLTVSNLYKTKGVELFREPNIEEAFYKFSAALKLALLIDPLEESIESDLNDLKVALYNNLANCQLHFKNYSSVVKLCNSSIEIIMTSKALYRRALSYIELKEYEKAQNDLIELLKLEPQNKAALDKYKLVRELDRHNRENYESVIKKMFQ